MIETNDLSKQFDGFWAVDGVSLKIQPGQVLALLGPNGAGKTTTVRMLTSVLSPSRGWAKVAGYDVVRESDKVRSSVGVLTEHHGLYGRMNAVEYLDFFGDLYRIDRKVRRQKIDCLLEQFGLGLVRKKRLGEYSKGMRQKLALVRALLHEPPVLLLDEPTSAMDPASSRLVRDAIHQLRSRDRTIVLCTHNLAEAEELADQIAIIQRGKIIHLDTLDSLKKKLLGSTHYVITYANRTRELIKWEDMGIQFPEGVEPVSVGDHQLEFKVDNPEQTNPELLQRLVSAGLQVISFSEVPRSLEQAYLEAVNHTQEYYEII
ncbi:MAG TPA: ABC transporter ATP-binding protein [Anaerolineaceae bacterium]